MKENGPIDLSDIDFGPTIRGNQPGDKLFNRFVLKEILGRGGMGVVWLVDDDLLSRPAVLKFVPEAVRYDETAVEELKNETRKGLDLAHPNIVKVYDFLMDGKNAAISMEFVDGDTISVLRVKQPAKVFQPEDIENWVRQLLSGLEYAHESARIVHRDLKPSNLLIHRERNELKITDFGIARSVADSLSRTTVVGNSAGTLSYMSPQQALGAPAHVSDDIYSFGSTLFELLTGKPPFYTGDITSQVRSQQAPAIVARRAEFGVQVPPIPRAWEETIAACLAKKPEDRPRSAAEIAVRLGIASPSGGTAVITSRTNGAPPPPPPQPAARPQGLREVAGPAAGKKPAAPSKKGPLLVLLGLGLPFLAIAGAGGWIAWKHLGPRIAVLDRPETPGQPVAKDSPDALRREIEQLVKSPDDFPAAREKLAAYLKTFGSDEFYAANLRLVEKQPAKESAGPKDFSVPSKFPTIQAAIDAAAPGDTIRIAAGRYEESIRLKPRMRLLGSEAGKVIIAPGGTDSPTLLADNAGFALLENLTLAHSGEEDTRDAKHPVVLAQSTIVELLNCRIERAMGNGLQLVGSTAKPSKMENTVIERCTVNGVRVERGASLVVKSSAANRNGVHGYSVVHSGSSLALDNCDSATNGNSGACAESGSTITASGSRFNGNGEAGLAFIDHAIGKISGSILSANVKLGLVIQDGSTGEYTSNTIEKSGEHGLAIYDADAATVVTSNTIIGNTRCGALLALRTSPPVLVSKNRLTGNGVAGIGVMGDGSNPTLQGNIVNSNIGEGILLDDGSRGLVEDNTVSGNTGAGILAVGSGSQPVIRKNKATGNGGQGIEAAEGAKPEIGENEVSGNNDPALAKGKAPAPPAPGPQPAPQANPVPAPAPAPVPVNPAPVPEKPAGDPLPSSNPKVPTLVIPEQ